MEIVRLNKEELKINEIEVGECFITSKSLYIRVEGITGIYGRGHSGVVTIDLATGEAVAFNGDVIVQPICCKVVEVDSDT